MEKYRKDIIYILIIVGVIALFCFYISLTNRSEKIAATEKKIEANQAQSAAVEQKQKNVIDTLKLSANEAVAKGDKLIKSLNHEKIIVRDTTRDYKFSVITRK